MANLMVSFNFTSNLPSLPKTSEVAG